MKILCAAFLSILLFVVGSFSQVKKEESNAALKTATIKITLLDLPGVSIEKSKWEVAYEVRIANQKELDDASINGTLTLDAKQKLGEFIAKGNFTKNTLSKKENREVILTIPLDKKIQEKLAGELKSLIKSNATKPNKNTSQSATEDRMKTQNFLIYGNALIYDAKLKKNIIVPFDWLLPFTRFTRFPNANFEITLKINEIGEFTRRWVLPEKPKNSMTITTKQ